MLEVLLKKRRRVKRPHSRRAPTQEVLGGTGSVFQGHIVLGVLLFMTRDAPVNVLLGRVFQVEFP